MPGKEKSNIEVSVIQECKLTMHLFGANNAKDKRNPQIFFHNLLRWQIIISATSLSRGITTDHNLSSQLL